MVPVPNSGLTMDQDSRPAMKALHRAMLLEFCGPIRQLKVSASLNAAGFRLKVETGALKS